MIDKVITLLDIAAKAPVATSYGLVTINDGPVRNNGGGQFTKIAVDTAAPWSYWRINGDVTASEVDMLDCIGGLLLTAPLRMVLLLDSDCTVPDVLLTISERIRSSLNDITATLTANRVIIGNIGQRTFNVDREEGIPKVPLQRVLVALDMTVQLTIHRLCLETCGTIEDLVCAVISSASMEKIQACLTDDQLAAICTGTEGCTMVIEFRNPAMDLLATSTVLDPCVVNTLTLVYG